MGNNIPTEKIEFPKDKYNWAKAMKFCDSSIIEDKERLRISYISQMVRRTSKLFKWENLPDTIIEREFERQLQLFGYCAFTKVEVDEATSTAYGTKSGFYTLFGGTGGRYDAYYLPTKINVANPALRFNKSLKINEDCILVQNDMNFEGLFPIMDRYASLLAEIDLSIRILSINSRYLTVMYADNDDTALSIKEFIETLKAGRDIGFISAKKVKFVEDEVKDFFDTKQFTASGAGELIKAFIELKQYLIGSWFRDLGIQAPYNMKREALSEGEIDLGDDTLQPLIDEMLEMRKLACDKINAKYGLNISVELDSTWKERKEESEAKKELIEEQVETVKLENEQLEEQPEEKPEEQPEKKEGEENE